MDYLIDFPLWPSPAPRGDTEREFAALQARLAARRALEQALGGSAPHVLLAWLGCMDCGGVPEVCCTVPRGTSAQQIWSLAQEAAIVAAHRAVGVDLASWPADAAGEFWEHAHFSLAMAAPAEFRARESWIDAFLGRLRELGFAVDDLMSAEHGETAFELDGGAHPIFAADALYLECDPSVATASRGIDALPAVARTAYVDLATELAAIARATGH